MRSQNAGTIVRTERARPNQSLAFEVPDAPSRIVGIVAQVVPIAFGHNPKSTDGSRRAARGLVRLAGVLRRPPEAARLTHDRKVYRAY